MSNREEKRSAADEALQKELGMAAAGFRQASARRRYALSLWRDARSRAQDHTAAAANARKALLDPRMMMAKEYLAIADAHKAVADRARREAIRHAVTLVYRVTPELVRQRLAMLDPATAATITRLFGDNLADASTRARVFEACDFAQWEGADEIALTERDSI